MSLSKIQSAFEKMDYDPVENQLVVHEKGNQYKAVKFNITNREEFAKKLLENVKSKKYELAKVESEFNFQPLQDALREIELSIQFAEYYLSLGFLQSKEPANFQNRTYTPVFRVIVELFSRIAAGATDFTWKFSENQENFITELLGGLDVEFLGFVEKSFRKMTLSYTTMIITESSDIESATDVLAKSWNNIYVPWIIRNVLVQESVYPKFMEIIKPKLRPFPKEYLMNKDLTNKTTSTLEKLRKMGLTLIHNDSDANPVKPTIVKIGNREFFDEIEYVTPIVTLDVFRTSKEALQLAHSGGSASIWCENISMAFELAKGLKCSNVWVNCNGLFHPSVPFQFSGTIYGSQGAIEGWFDTNKVQYIKVNSKFIGNTHFQTILEYDDAKNVKSFKTIVIPFGTTFAN